MSSLIPFNRKNRNVSNVTPTNPFNMIDDFFDDAFKDFPLARRNLVTDPFKVDIQETDNEYLVDAELPGIKKNDIDVTLNDEGRLTISVNREENVDTKDEDNNYIHQERRYDSMQRSLFLANAKTDDVKAKLEDGLLRITVGKDEQAVKDNSRKIEIE
ncbi:MULTISPECIES: Hsp20/alpha crystallin family protein [Bacillaceae]|uniref:Hsp20/alpha crystallin family protein n=1 Tax=Lentibacillus salicampi TaxID=175306 RepID=A0A4Y9A6U2_9BACI|nr:MULTISPECIES: Hsp20/alpha crystallin family protein [Bacillaceae]TFJ89942.1 Hsp20/alpha crystallin family protein [Lentibacillus salicampi]